MYIEKYTHSYEHKGALDDINVSLILDCGFSDVSWHNDAMPSFVNADESIRVWCDYADPDEREFQDYPRFAVWSTDPDHSEPLDVLLETEDYSELIEFLKGLENA